MFWDHADGADFFLNANVNVVMLALPVLRFLPGKYSRQYRSARKAFEKLEKYFQNIMVRTTIKDAYIWRICILLQTPFTCYINAIFSGDEK
jgi:cellulose biosynthesis protein BcsQ